MKTALQPTKGEKLLVMPGMNWRKETGKSVVSGKNYLEITQKERKRLK